MAARADLLTSVPGFGDVVAQAWLGEIGPAPHLHLATCQRSSPSWITLCPGEQHQRPQAQARPDRGCRDLHQADAGAGGLVRDPGPGATAAPSTTGLVRQLRRRPRTRPRRRRRSPRSRTPCSRSPTRCSRAGRRTRSLGADFYTRRESPKQRARPGWNASCKGFTPAAPSPSPSARRRPP